MKRTVFLAVALFALMAVGVYAQTEADFDVTVSKDGKSVTIDGYSGSATAVNFPARIKNLPVTSIRGFSDGSSPVTSVTSVNIPNGVTSIENGVFQNLINLTSVTIPNTVTSIGNNAFSATSLESVTIPASVKSIGRNAFNNCTKLVSVTFGGSIPSSGFDATAFNNLGDIRDKYLAAGGGAGTYTRQFMGPTWTKGTSAAAVPAAAGTPGLKFDLTNDGKGYVVSRGTVALGDIVIPSSYNNLPVTLIKNLGFANSPIGSVIIPASVTEIGDNAFAKCASLNSVTIQGTIPANKFWGFDGDLKTKYLAGGAGTYTRSGTTWTKK